jgi:hypothetical protein
MPIKYRGGFATDLFQIAQYSRLLGRFGEGDRLGTGIDLVYIV